MTELKCQQSKDKLCRPPYYLTFAISASTAAAANKHPTRQKKNEMKLFTLTFVTILETHRIFKDAKKC